MGTETNVIICGNIVIDLATHTVTIQGREIFLTVLEFNLLVCLAEHQGQSVCAGTLLEQVWYCETGGTKDQVKSCIKRLRQKLGRESAIYLQTHWGWGYCLCDPGIPPRQSG